MTDVRADYERLGDLAGRMLGISERFTSVDDASDFSQGVFGDGVLREAVQDFAAGWSDGRHKIRDGLVNMSGLLLKVAESYREMDEQFTGAGASPAGLGTPALLPEPLRHSEGSVSGRLAGGGQYHRDLQRFDSMEQSASDSLRWRLAEVRDAAGRTGAGGDDHNSAARSEIERIKRAQQLISLAAKAQDLDPANFWAHSKVVKLDTQGDGTAVTVLGDLRSADRVVIVVPGMNTDLDSMLPPDGDTGEGHDRLALPDARELFDHYQKDGDRVAVVSWLDYDAPDYKSEMGDSSIDLGDVFGARKAMDESLARAGGTRLHNFVMELNRAGVSGERVSLIGHSYGSLVVSHALRGNIDVDRAIVIGSPGLGSGIEGIEHLKNPDVNVWVGTASDDPIQLVPLGNLFGADPTSSGFGARQLDVSDASGHSSYFGPEALPKLASVAIGKEQQ